MELRVSEHRAFFGVQGGGKRAIAFGLLAWLAACFTLAAGCTELSSPDSEKAADSGIRKGGDGGPPSTKGTDAASGSGGSAGGGTGGSAGSETGGSGGSDAGSTDSGASNTDSGAATMDSGAVVDSGSVEPDAAVDAAVDAGPEVPEPVPCTGLTYCRLHDNSTGVCTDGFCEPCATGPCDPADCLSDDNCEYLDGPCVTGACNLGECEARPRPAGTTCNDGKWCTVDDACDSAGQCVGPARPCSDGLTCTDDRCDEAGAFCTSTRTSGCLIANTCVPADAVDPTNVCRWCDPTRSVSGYSPRPAATVCDDGLFCTVSETCNGAGSCAGNPRSCNDALSCTTDSCNETSNACTNALASGCMIGGACITANAADPTNVCRKCDPARSTSAYSTITAAANGDGCCPAGANATNDNDCKPICGNRVVEGFEGCDDGTTAGGCTSICTNAPVQRGVALTSGSSCALTSQGKLTCWGHFGANNPHPDDTFIDLCANAFVCGLRPNGEAVCWDAQNNGQRTPPAGDRFKDIACGGDAACGLRSNGTVACWGDDNGLLTEPPDTFSMISGGQDVVCGLRTSNQTVVCWGDNFRGGLTGIPNTPFVRVQAGYSGFCGTTSNGTLDCWGNWVQAGVDGLTGVSRLDLGQGATCVVKTNSTLQCWSDSIATPETVSEMPTGTGFSEVALTLLGGPHACAITAADKVYCWGRENGFNQQDPPAELRP